MKIGIKIGRVFGAVLVLPFPGAESASNSTYSARAARGFPRVSSPVALASRTPRPKRLHYVAALLQTAALARASLPLPTWPGRRAST